MEVVINASPIIFLSKIERIWILDKLFDKVFIPKAVLQEVNVCKMAGRENQLDLISYEILEVVNQTAVLGMLGRLHKGEVEVMIGAATQGVRTVVLDDRYARNKAKQLGLEVTGTLGLLLRANKVGLIDNLTSDIQKLKRAGMYISDEIIARILSGIY